MMEQRTGQMAHDCHSHHKKCISWGAIITGALVAVGLGFLLNVFSMAIGLSTFTNKTGALTLAIGGFIGMLIGTIASQYFAGWVSGYIARGCCIKNQRVGVLYGLATWCLALVLTVVFASYFAQFIFVSLHSMFTPGFAVMNAVGNKSAEMASMVAPNLDISTKMGISLFLTFVLFFVGAVASCIGGYCGIKCKEGNCH